MTAAPEFIFMLTRDDVTVPDAVRRVSEVAAINGISTIGFKDVGLPFDELRRVADAIRSTGRSVAMEVVSLDEAAELHSAEAALDLGADLLLGGTRAERVTRITAGTPIRYWPFPGKVVGHPSELVGALDDIVTSARRLAAIPGVHGLDLLAYRWADGDPVDLARSVVAAVDVPVIAAGSVDRPERVRALAEAGVWGFTVGSAAFDRKFVPGDFGLEIQLNAILAALNASNA